MASALLTGLFFAFVILAAGKWISTRLFLSSVQIPLYDATAPLTASSGYSGGLNVDKEVPDISPIPSSILPIPSPTSPRVSPPAPVPPPVPVPVVSAQAYLVTVLNANTSLPERTVVEKESMRALPIASLTKLATAVVAEQVLDQNKSVTITKKILATYHNDPAGFREGEQMKVGQLLYPLLMVSSNDAGEALAQSYTPGRAWFIKAMNDWAYSIGAYNTFFADPTGLSPENISSPHDLAIILAWIYVHHAELVAITATKVKFLGVHTWTSPTQLLNLSSYLAGKNGYLPESGQTSVSLFEINKKRYIVVTLNSQARDQDVLSLLQKI